MWVGLGLRSFWGDPGPQSCMARTRQGTSSFAALAETRDPADPRKALGSRLRTPVGGGAEKQVMGGGGGRGGRLQWAGCVAF